MVSELANSSRETFSEEAKRRLISNFERNVQDNFPTLDETILKQSLKQLDDAKSEDELRTIGVKLYEGYKLLEGGVAEEEAEPTAEDLAEAAELVAEQNKEIEETKEVVKNTLLEEKRGQITSTFTEAETQPPIMVDIGPEPATETVTEQPTSGGFFRRIRNFFGGGETPASVSESTRSTTEAVAPKEIIRDRYAESYTRETGVLAAVFGVKGTTELGYAAEIGISEFVDASEAEVVDRRLAELGYIMAGDTNTVPEYTRSFFKAPMADGSFQYRLLVTPQERLKDMETNYGDTQPDKYNNELALREALSILGDTYLNRDIDVDAQSEEIIGNPATLDDGRAYDFRMNEYLNPEALMINASEESKQAIIDVLEQMGYDDKESDAVDIRRGDPYYELSQLDDGRFIIEVQNIPE